MDSTLIRVEAADAGYRVRLFAGVGGAPVEITAADLAGPLDEAELQGIRQVLLGASADPRAAGHRLRELLLDNAVGDALRERFAAGDACRVLVNVQPEELRGLPWELMRSDDDGLLFADLRHPFARVADKLYPAPREREHCWPLRVLLVEGSAAGDAAVQAEAEKEHVRDAFRRVCGLVDVEVLEQPSLERLREVYEELRPHVFHFVGHGALDPTGRGYLEIDQGRAGAAAWHPPLIKAMLSSWRPRLAVLNACHSGDLDQQQAVHSVAAVFANQGVGAVVAMQGRILGLAAAKFAAGLYGRLAKGAPIDVAVASARVDILTALGDEREFALPTLLLAQLPDDVLNLSVGELDGLLGRDPYRRVKGFVNRSTDRRKLWERVRPRETGSAIAVVGDALVGKSSLVRWCLGLRALQGDNVAYVDLNREHPLASSGVLDAITTALGSAPGHAAGNAAALSRYTAEVADLLAQPDDWSAVYGAFTRALEQAAADAPLLIALDHVSGVESWDWKQLVCEHLVRPIGAGTVSNVHLMVVVRSGEAAERLPASLAGAYDEFSVNGLVREEYPVVAAQFLRTYGIPRASFEEVLTALYASLAPRWGGPQFQMLELLATTQQWEREA